MQRVGGGAVRLTEEDRRRSFLTTVVMWNLSFFCFGIPLPPPSPFSPPAATRDFDPSLCIIVACDFSTLVDMVVRERKWEGSESLFVEVKEGLLLVRNRRRLLDDDSIEELELGFGGGDGEDEER